MAAYCKVETHVKIKLSKACELITSESKASIF